MVIAMIWSDILCFSSIRVSILVRLEPRYREISIDIYNIEIYDIEIYDIEIYHIEIYHIEIYYIGY
jgi:phosphoenolpyruvate synthase/pyruvate phosphate dikinase